MGGAGPGGDSMSAPRSICPHGHALTGENLYLTPRGWRRCRACNRERQARRSGTGRVSQPRLPRGARCLRRCDCGGLLKRGVPHRCAYIEAR